VRVDAPVDDAAGLPPAPLPDEDGDRDERDGPAVAKKPEHVDAVRALVERERDERELGDAGLAVDGRRQAELDEVKAEED